jgi:hypothetical protein
MKKSIKEMRHQKLIKIEFFKDIILISNKLIEIVYNRELFQARMIQ